ncbi:MAG: hypothetical protein PHD97_09580 [Bacteroidales bacterium]|nr:hypothetical protein [Bacteroidales bacterium]
MSKKHIKIILFSFLILLLFTDCRKRKEMLLIGKWERVFIENPNFNEAHVWNFKDYRILEITIYNRETGSVKSGGGEKSYKLINAKQIKIWDTGDPENAEIFDLIKVNKKILRIIKMDAANNSLDSWNYEFTRMAN